MKLSSNSYIRRREKEIVELLDKFDITIKERLVKDLIISYNQLINEIYNKGFDRKNSLDLPRLNHFLKSLFLHLFEKLHCGDKQNADKLITELKLQLYLLDQKSKPALDPNNIIDDVSYTQEAYKAVIKKYNNELEQSIKDIVLEYYNRAIIEISQGNLISRSGYPEPKLENFIYHAFSYLFSKLHKGDKQKAHKIIDKMKTDIIDNKIIN